MFYRAGSNILGKTKDARQSGSEGTLVRNISGPCIRLALIAVTKYFVRALSSFYTWSPGIMLAERRGTLHQHNKARPFYEADQASHRQVMASDWVLLALDTSVLQMSDSVA